ncbi:hypothetical protein [Bordetella pertussis]|uniref:hypothetical protein n=1 Tax=Bordetella pertussis TaxID=520 RepID=UPI0021CAEE3B|nr:hypothetical protein [Bordetella pertussis]
MATSAAAGAAWASTSDEGSAPAATPATATTPKRKYLAAGDMLLDFLSFIFKSVKEANKQS